MGQNSTLSRFRISRIPRIAALLIYFCLLGAATQAQVTVSVTSTNVSCFGGSNGTATATGGGGWSPYTYHWSTGATTASVTGLAAGTYYVTATDVDQGYAVGTVIISQPPQLGVQVYGESQICGIVPDGKVTAVPYGGTQPYTYHWSNGGTTAQITGLPEGTYTVTVTDANGCTTAGSGTVYFWNEGIWLMDTSTNVTCFGLNNGTASIMGMSGTPPYTYHWSTGANTPSVSGLAPGNYTVTVTDANGCSNFTNILITQPPVLGCTSTTVNAACGLAGSATVFPSGGTPPYSIVWNTGSTSFTITGMPGTYTATLTDANGCTKPVTVTIGGTNTTLTVTATVITNAGCTVGGKAMASASGGSGNYAFSWDNGQSTAMASNLSAGNHSVTVTDITTGCTGVGTVNIPTAPTLTATAVVVTNATCLVGGSATATGAGGTPPYTFKWDNNQTTATATNLGAGPHSVTVTDATGCVATAIVIIGQTQGPTVTAVVNNNASCTAGGKATATATGGAGGYIFLWDNGQNTAMATNLSVGVHHVTVTDAAGCSATAMVTITQPGAPTAIVSPGSPANCTSGGGSANAGATGGTPPYSFHWSTGANTQNITNLSAGTYTVTVTDALGCTSTGQVSVAAAIPPNVVIVASSNARCDQPGSATASASGGATPYSYHWDNNENTAVATNLTAGTHTVTVTDAAGCTATATVTIGTTANGITIGDFVWYDDTQDGFQNNIELDGGVPGVTVMLIKAGTDGNFGTADDVIVATTTTNNDGIYHFTCVTPGTYVIMFSGIPAGYVFSPKDNTSNDCNDSDAGANGKTSPFTIIAGQPDNLCFDAGIHIPCANVTYAGFICCDQIICEGQTPNAITQVNPPSGGSGAFEYQWMQLVLVNGLPAWQPIPGANSANYQPGALFETSRYMRCARRAGCNNFLESNIIVITVQPAGGSNCPDFTSDIHALVQPNNTVGIDWVTGAEGDAYIYTVQRSTNRTTWDVVTTVMGQHNTTGPNTYTAIDQTPLAGTSFYRIKRSNANGINAFSQSVEVRLDLSAVTAVTVNPNPVTDKLLIKNVMSYDSDVIVTISTTQGDIVHTLTIPKGSIIQEEVTMSNLPSGIYMVRIKLGNGEVKTVKIAKI